MIDITNREFLELIFGDDHKDAHVCGFVEDPTDIDNSRYIWSGDRFSNFKFPKEKSNQFFCISTFEKVESQRSRRRKSEFKKCYLIVLDDVKEKLPIEQVQKLPSPTYILETSIGSEQWGYALASPCDNINLIDSLVNGLIEKGISPDFKDPGMKGVTRYVRLPESYNSKKSKLIDGKPVKCRLIKFDPLERFTIEELAEPFDITLNYNRAIDIIAKDFSDFPDHPLLNCDLKIKGKLGAGRYDVECLWLDDHTNRVNNGTAIFFNADGTFGYKCHHGHCESKDIRHVIEVLGEEFLEAYNRYTLKVQMAGIEETEQKSLEQLANKFKTTLPNSPEMKTLCYQYFDHIVKLDEFDKTVRLNELREITLFTKAQMNAIYHDYLQRRYLSTLEQSSIYQNAIFIRELNKFYDRNTKIFYSPDAFYNSFIGDDENIRKEALIKNKVKRVDKLDFYPNQTEFFSVDNIEYCNTWVKPLKIYSRKGNIDLWLDHFKFLKIQESKDHILKWMAHTIQKPEIKINHILLLGGKEGIGKDFLLYPLVKAMGEYCSIVQGKELLSNFNDFLLNCKYLHINETELGDHKLATQVSTELKPLASAPPDTLKINRKGQALIDIRNIVNVSMATNSQNPIRLNGQSRRFYAVWSPIDIRSEIGEVLPDIQEDFKVKWAWMKSEGYKYCIEYLANQIDLKGFDPGSAPKTTAFLRDMYEHSKTLPVKTIDELIRQKQGNFGKRFVTDLEMLETIKALDVIGSPYLYKDGNWFNLINLRDILKTMLGIERKTFEHHLGIMTIYCLQGGFPEGCSSEEAYRLYIVEKEQFTKGI